MASIYLHIIVLLRLPECPSSLFVLANFFLEVNEQRICQKHVATNTNRGLHNRILVDLPVLSRRYESQQPCYIATGLLGTWGNTRGEGTGGAVKAKNKFLVIRSRQCEIACAEYNSVAGNRGSCLRIRLRGRLGLQERKENYC